jgi:hypothetical protein
VQPRPGTAVAQRGHIIANGEEVDPRELFASKRLRYCQMWRIPKVESHFYKIKTKHIEREYTSNIKKQTGFELFCPKCDLFFMNKREYQEHLLWEQMRKPFHQEAKTLATKNKEAEEKDAEIEAAIARRSTIRKASFAPNKRISVIAGKTSKPDKETLQNKLIEKYMERYGIDNKQNKEALAKNSEKSKQSEYQKKISRRKTLLKKQQKFTIEPEERRMFTTADAMAKVLEAKGKRDEERSRREERERRKAEEWLKPSKTKNRSKNRASTSNRGSKLNLGPPMRESLTTPTSGYRQSIRRQSLRRESVAVTSQRRSVEVNRTSASTNALFKYQMTKVNETLDAIDDINE